MYQFNTSLVSRSLVTRVPDAFRRLCRIFSVCRTEHAVTVTARICKYDVSERVPFARDVIFYSEENLLRS